MWAVFTASATLSGVLVITPLPLTVTSATAAQPGVGALAAPRLPFGARVLRATPPHTPLSIGIFLRPRAPHALAAFATAVGSEHSVLFGHYLARGAFAARFGPTRATIARVERFLTGQGLRVRGLSSNHLELRIDGTAATLTSAFRTHLAEVALPNGRIGRATTAPLVLPPALEGVVVAVLGLDDLVAERDALERLGAAPHAAVHFARTRAPGTPGAPTACASAVGQTQAGQGGITDDQVAHAYGADGLYAAGDLGAGQTVAVFELEPFARSDVRAFDTCYFGTDHTSSIRAVNVDGGPGTGAGSGEAALDVEVISALAPGATIRVYQGPNNSAGAIDTYNRIVADDVATVASTSWGLCESDLLRYSPGSLAVENLLFEQAAAQGQTFFSAAGDAGNDACAYHSALPAPPLKSVEDPASQPYVVGVGGTTAVSVTQPPVETVWNDGYNGGGTGGGVSSVWHEPPWLPAAATSQSSRAACAAGRATTCRTVPDVSAFADEFTGITVVWSGQWYTFGGTSWSAPTWAALLAEVNASSTCRAATATARGVGFAAPLLYDVASVPADYASSFTDITVGDNDIYGVDGGQYRARPGYDLATGLGSPELTATPGTSGPGLAQSLCEAAQGASGVRVRSVTPARGGVLGGTPFRLTGSGFAPGGRSDVRQVDFGTSPAASFTVVSDTLITGTTSAATTPTSRALPERDMGRSGGVLVAVSTTADDVATGPTFHYVVVRARGTVPEVAGLGPTGASGRGGARVDVYGTGFTDARAVTFGGIPARSFRVASDALLVAVAPPWQRSMCRAGSASTRKGICQTAVRVVGPGGASAVVGILPPLAGTLQYNRLGLIKVPPGCRCEAYPGATEFDYVTRLMLRSVTGVTGRPELGDPGGGNELLFTGRGMNVLTLGWINFGPASSADSQDYDVGRISSDGTWADVFSGNDPRPSPRGNTVAVSLATVGGNSDTRAFRYLPIQVVTSLSTNVLPAAGGVSFLVHGGGFREAKTVLFEPTLSPLPPVMVPNFQVRSATEISFASPAMVSGSYQIYVCGTYACGTGEFFDSVGSIVAVIAPSTTGVTSAELVPSGAQPTGTTSGGTTFEVQGTNFGSLGQLRVVVQNEDGATTTAGGIVAGPAPTDPGATETVLVTSPPSPEGTPGVCDVLLMGADGSSTITPTAVFRYSP